MILEQELLLVDDYDKFSGNFAAKSFCHTGKGLRHRAFTVLVLNKNNEVLLQNRRHKLWDNVWDLTNSHPLKTKNGYETYEEAIDRCFLTEWGIKVETKKVMFFNYEARYGEFCENECCALYAGRYNGEVHPNHEVAYGYKWMPFEELILDIDKNPTDYTPWLIRAIGQYKKSCE